MSIVKSTPQMRFEVQHGDLLTVLEGEELSRLLSRFFWHLRREVKHHEEVMEAYLVSVLRAYQGLYGREVVSDLLDEVETGDLKTANARKVDLFYQGMLEMFEVAAEQKRTEADA